MRKIAVGITGATGVIMGIRLLEVLSHLPTELHLVISDSGKKNIEIETEYDLKDIEKMATRVHNIKDMTAPIASGSFKMDGMVIVPCSIKTLSSIANSYNANLIVRAADCILKEKKILVVVPRETPFHRGHLDLMARVCDMGGVILPPMPAFYNEPKSISDIIDHIVGKILDQFDIESNLFKRWGSQPVVCSNTSNLFKLGTEEQINSVRIK